MRRVIFITYGPINDLSFGGAQRTNHLRVALMASAQVDTLIINEGDLLLSESWSIERLRKATVAAYGISPKALLQRWMLTKWISSLLDEGRYDFIVVQYLDLALLVPKNLRSRTIFDPDDLIKTLGTESRGSLGDILKLKIRNYIAQRVARSMLHVWYANPTTDQLPDNPQRSFLPNVVKIPDLGRQRRSPSPRRLLIVGLFTHKPNAEGLTWFCKHVLGQLQLRFPDLQLHAVGRYPNYLQNDLPSVHFHGFVENLTVAYDDAEVVIAPILSGGGSQIKVIDALVHERPLVASEFAYSGFARDLVAGEHLLVADSVEDWITACSKLLSDPIEARAMAKRGAVRATACYHPDRMVREVNATFAFCSQTL